MAKNPRWTPRIDPSGSGPMMAVEQNADAPWRALAGAGRQVFQLGSFLSAEAKEAEEKTKRLQQATQVSQFGLDAVKDYNKLKEDLSTVQDPDVRGPKFEETRAKIRQRLDAIADPDVRSQAETWLNQEESVWDADIRTGTQQLRIKQADSHLAALGEDAVRRRDISQIDGYARHLTEAGFISEQQKTDLVAQYESQVTRELAKDQVTAATMAQASHADQVKFLKRLDKPEALNDQEWADFRDGLFAKLDVDRAAAAQEKYRRAAVVEQNDRKLFADAQAGTLDIPAALKAMQDGTASTTAVDQAIALAKKPPAERVDDPQVYFEAERWLTKVRQDPSKKGEAIEWLKGNLAALPQSWKNYAQGYEKAGDPADPLTDPQYKLLDGLIDDNFFANKDGTLTFGAYRGAEAERSYILAKQQFRRYRVENPEATQEELTAEYERLFSVPERVTIGSRIWDWIKLSAPGYGPGLRLSRALYGPEEAQPAATLARPDAEPLSQREFEDTVKTFAAGSKEQVEYYRKWAGKWQ